MVTSTTIYTFDSQGMILNVFFYKKPFLKKTSMARETLPPSLWQMPLEISIFF